jgi:drug/metabolite transporter (DMT)-like permease
MLAIAVKISGLKLKTEQRALPSIAVLAIVGCCITPLLLYISYTDIYTGTATVFHFIYPAAVMLLSLIFLKTKLKAGNLISLLLCIAGICMFYTPGVKVGIMGSAVALLSGVTYASYIVGLSAFRYKNIPNLVFYFYGAISSSLLSLIFCLCTGNLVFPASVKGWILCILFALIFNVGAGVLFQKGTFIIGGERASILSTFEPITSVIVGMTFLNESGSFRTVIGTVLVVAAAVLIAVYDTKHKNSKE